MVERGEGEVSGDGGTFRRRQRRWRKPRTTTTMMEKAADNDNDGRGSYRRWHQGQRKLQMCPSVVEEAANLSLNDKRSCTWKQWRWRELRMKDTVVGTSDTSIDGRSVGPVHRRWRQWLAEPEVSQGGKDLGFIGHTSREERAGGFIVTIYYA